MEQVEDSPDEEYSAKLRGASEKRAGAPGVGVETQSPLAPRTRRSPSKIYRLRRGPTGSVKALNDGEASSNL